MAVTGIRVDSTMMTQYNEIQVVISDSLPPQELTTAAFALVFDGDRLLMTNLRRRGWDVPGGHVEPGESPEDTMRREVYEETAAKLGLARPIGYQWIRVLVPRPKGFPFPYPDSYQAFFVARVVSLDEFVQTEEVAGRGLFPPEEARRLAWVEQNRDLYEAARTADVD